VRRVDGRIWVEPNGGQGSIFYVEIPAAGSVGAPQKGRPKAAVGR
jgi:signal transduction histidine kinase